MFCNRGVKAMKEENGRNGSSVGNGFDTSFNDEDVKLVEDVHTYMHTSHGYRNFIFFRMCQKPLLLTLHEYNKTVCLNVGTLQHNETKHL